MMRLNFGRKPLANPVGGPAPAEASASAAVSNPAGGTRLSPGLVRINLLPHRELKRAARQRQFIFLAVSISVLALLIIVLVHGIIGGKIDNQTARNTYLEGEITQLDKQISEIQKLKEQIQAMLSRKKVVETLQGNRSQPVYLLDQMVRLLPDGLYLKSFKQGGNVVTVQGYAQSNARVASFIRNLDTSPWLEAPELIETKAAMVEKARLIEFSLKVKLTPLVEPDDDGGKKSPVKP
jgi:type IV pilus assembly protein PilN